MISTFMILLHKVAHMFFEKLFFHYIGSVGIFCRLTKFSSYVMSFSNWILLWSRNMRDRPVVVVMDGWHLREKSKVFLKFFFFVWYNVAWKNVFSHFQDLCKIQEINELLSINCISIYEHKLKLSCGTKICSSICLQT